MSRNYPPDSVEAVAGDIERAVRYVLSDEVSEAGQILVSLENSRRERKKGSAPDRVKLAVYQRDNFTCRYCGIKTIFLPVLVLLSSRFPEIFPYDKHWKTSHHVYWTHSTACDHIEPLARGGETVDPENLATACYQCNDTKSNHLLVELRWDLLPSSTTPWDGLSNLYPDLYAASPWVHERTHPDYSYHAGWIKLFR